MVKPWGGRPTRKEQRTRPLVYIQRHIHVSVTCGHRACCAAVGGGPPCVRRPVDMLRRAPSATRFSKPIVLRDSAPLATLDEARAYLATLTPAQITPALYYARVMLGHAMRTGKARDIEKARLELIRALRATRGGRRTVRRRAPGGGEPE